MISKIEKEKIIVEKMITLYCKKKHGNASLCNSCIELVEYAKKRLDKCHFGEDKPSCKLCKVHCYNAVKRKQVREMMRFSGPRMLLYYPFQYLLHQSSKILKYRKQ